MASNPDNCNVERVKTAGAGAVVGAAAEQGWRPLHCRFLPRRRRERARRDRPAGRDDGPARLRGGTRMVRREPLPGLPLFARPLGRDGRGPRRIRPQAHPRRVGLRRRGSSDPEAMLAQGYRGSRYSFGYPACPNLADQKQLLALLRAEEIGITLSEEDQLDPEQSTSAIVLHHPQAKYFSV